MTDRTITFTVDGQEVRCSERCTIYEAATAAGIHIPTFCHHDKLVPVGACRMCLVEIAGMRGLQTACTTPVRDGMVVKVHTSPVAVKARKANLEFLLINHPLDCPVCDKGGECPLQNQALQDGPGQSRYIEPKRHKNKRHALGELIVLDQERCVLCWRCIRFLDEWADNHELDLFGRGAATVLNTFPGRPLTSKWQGNTIDICPVGALTSRVFRFEARVWELANTSSICPMCAVGCNITLGVKNNELRRVTPRENLQVNDAWICDRGRFAHGFVDHPDRLKTPLIRRDGELTPATWDEAFELISRRFRQILETHGPEAIAGLGSTRVTNEANYLFQRFMRSVVGTNSVDHQDRMPARATPLRSLPNLEYKDVIVLLGCDPSNEAPLVELWIKKAVLRHGARVLVANPRRIELGWCGGPWLGYRPGGEVALLNGLAQAIFEAGSDRQTAHTTARRVTNRDEFRASLKGYDPRQVERLTGVSPDSLLQAAQLLAGARNPILLYGSSWIRGAVTGTESSGGDPSGKRLDAIENLTLVLGEIEAGFLAEDNNTLGATEMGVVPDSYPGGEPVDDNKVRSRLASFWGGKLSPVEGLDFDRMMLAGREGDLKAMWVMGTDPADNCVKAAEALGRVPFLVVQDLFLTDTASMAEVVLPAASFSETGGSFFNLTGRLQAIHAGMRPPGQARPDWWIITELARRLVDSKRRRCWDFSGPTDVLEEIVRVLPGYRGLDSTAPGETGWQRSVAQASTRRSFVRVESEQAPVRSGLTGVDPDYPLILITGRSFYDRGTLLRRSEWIQKLVPEAFVLIHPVDAGNLGLADGDQASVVSATGRLGLTVRVSDDIVPGVAFAPLNLSDAPLSVLAADHRTLPRVRIRK
jgi:NADH-quinone oxidoreductase chain G